MKKELLDNIKRIVLIVQLRLFTKINRRPFRNCEETE